MKRVHRIILTGAPGSGKSSVIDQIALKHAIVPETARYWLDVIKNNNLTGLFDAQSFQKVLEANMIKDWIENPNAYYDRSLVDQLAYRNFFHKKNDEYYIFSDLCKFQFRYDKVFYFPFWEEIYQTDSVRSETVAEAKMLDKLLLQAYQDMDYGLIIVPKLSVKERVEFVLENSRL